MTTTPPDGTVLPADQLINPGGDDNPPPDCPALVEDLAEQVEDIDVLAHCLAILVGEIPRLDSPNAERALRRVGRMAERTARVASRTALRAEMAVKLVRDPRGTPPPSDSNNDDGGGDGGDNGSGNGNGHGGG